MTLKLKVGRKGYIILPKAVREAVGIDEGDEVIAEIRDGILLKHFPSYDISNCFFNTFISVMVSPWYVLIGFTPPHGTMALSSEG